MIYKVTESFFLFSNSEKNYDLRNFSFFDKNSFFGKKKYNLETNMKFEKKLSAIL